MKFVGNAWKLSPSDLTFLWDECPRCFWLKVAGNLARPRAPFPKIFTLLDLQTKEYFKGKRAEDIAPALRPGRVLHGDRWVRSVPLPILGHGTPVLLGGRFDTALAFDDGTFGLVDFKTTDPKSSHIHLYSRQLHACALAAEHPAPGHLELAPVSQMGLLCVEPTSMVSLGAGVAYRATRRWVEIRRDDGAFLEFLAGVVSVLERPEPPDPSPQCTFCEYVSAGSLALLTQIYRP
jgi:PD-(D/E)XK nuclease superfamily protein